MGTATEEAPNVTAEDDESAIVEQGSTVWCTRKAAVVTHTSI